VVTRTVHRCPLSCVLMVWGRYPQGPLSPLYRAYTHASPNPNGLNLNVTVGRNSAGIATLGIYMLSYYLSIGGMGNCTSN
jgi:hypothetical protein